MKTPDPIALTSCLAATGNAWRDAVSLAADHLMQDYKVKWERLVPVELHRLAFTRHARIIPSDEIEREAVLLPAKPNFMILVKASLRGARFRCSIAHELAHTIFYTSPSESEAGRRIIEHSAKEEQFCFDVARHVLAPKWQLKALGLLDLDDPVRVLHRMVEDLLLSRLWAARVILADYSLASGVAGWWSRSEEGWTLEKGQATASPMLGREERSALREVAKDKLKGENVKDGLYSVVVHEESGGNRAFVMVLIK